MESQQKCLGLWTELDNLLPGQGRDSNHVEGNWSCWSGGRHIFGSKGMDCWQVVDFVGAVAKPKRILEIGFNAGHSASMWLSRTDATVLSIDYLYRDCVRIGSEFLKAKFPDRFSFMQCNSLDLYEKIKGQEFDMVVVDGGHATEVCLSDCNLALKLGAKWLVVDDAIVADSVRIGVDRFVEDNKDRVKLVNRWNVAWGVVFYEIQ